VKVKRDGVNLSELSSVFGFLKEQVESDVTLLTFPQLINYFFLGKSIKWISSDSSGCHVRIESPIFVIFSACFEFLLPDMVVIPYGAMYTSFISTWLSYD
jgi:hypothetical protein